MRLALLFAPALLLAQTWATRPPRVISRAEPEYSEEARRAGVNAAIVVSLLVNENGAPRDINVVRGAGFGLDERAIRAIEAWRFEPATKEGKPFAAPTHVELHFSVLDKAHASQTARLNFGLAPGVERPELIKGKIPSNPDQPGDASLRVRFTVGPDGQPKNFQTFETNNQEWTDRALQEMADWRFRPAMREGQPEEVYGVLELTVSRQAPENRPTLRRSLVTVSPAAPQDSSLPAPKLISPPDHAIFDSYSRRLTCKWEASPGAVSYLLEWDYMYRDAWHAESEGVPGAAYEVTATETTFDFVGAQPGRWRVWPVNSNGQRGNPSEWRTFRFLH
jgi:TonB family protein